MGLASMIPFTDMRRTCGDHVENGEVCRCISEEGRLNSTLPVFREIYIGNVTGDLRELLGKSEPRVASALSMRHNIQRQFEVGYLTRGTKRPEYNTE